jgi:FMN phosphatase YigB (HAD superfamily)
MRSPRISTIVFDYGNVLLEWNPRFVYRRYFPNDEQGMENFLKEIRFAEWNAQQDKGRPFEEGIAIYRRNITGALINQGITSLSRSSRCHCRLVDI